MHSLPLFVRLQGRPVILLGEGEAAAAKRVLLERVGADIVDEAAAASLAIVAIDDDDQALAAVARLKARGILVNAVDRAALCDFTLPAIIDRDPVLIAIGTGGASAGLAKALRQRLERLLPQSLGRVARGLKGARVAMRKRWPNAAERRRAIDAALDPGGALDVLADHAPRAVGRWISGEAANGAQSAFHHLTIISDDPDDLTLRQARLLGQADLIYYSDGIAPAILARGRADARREHGAVPPKTLGAGLVLFLERG